MWQFIISGYIPGTDVQVGYEAVSLFFASLCTSLLCVIFVKEFSTYRVNSLHFQSNNLLMNQPVRAKSILRTAAIRLTSILRAPIVF
jgi:hypothetical protein